MGSDVKVSGWLLLYNWETPPKGWEVFDNGSKRKGVHAKGHRVAKRVFDSLFMPIEHVIGVTPEDRGVRHEEMAAMYGEAKRLRMSRVKLYRVEGKEVQYERPASYVCRDRRFLESYEIEDKFEQFVHEALVLGCEISEVGFDDDWPKAIAETETGVAARCLTEAAKHALKLEHAESGHYIAWMVGWHIIQAAKCRATWPPGLKMDWNAWTAARDVASDMLDDMLRSLVS